MVTKDVFNCCVIGLGYIGLPTATLISQSGSRVLGVDINKSLVESISSCSANIIEPELQKCVESEVTSGRLCVSSVPSYSDCFIIAVPTPFYIDVGDMPTPNLEYVISAMYSIIPFLQPGNTIIIESTCPVGTTDHIVQLIDDNISFSVSELFIAYCPERVLPGQILNELQENDRVIGGMNNDSAYKAKAIYTTFCKANLYVTDAKTAELVKLAENSFRDVNIAFANEISILSDFYGVDVNNVISLSNYHPRVNILNPGCGVGGHCIAVDPWFIASAAPNLSPLIQAARKVNNAKPDFVIAQIMKSINKIELRKSSIVVSCMGLTYKPDVDDCRESPALYIAKFLVKQYPNTLVCEPNLQESPDFVLSSIDYCLKHSDLIVFLVAHSEFKFLSISASAEVLDFCSNFP